MKKESPTKHSLYEAEKKLEALTASVGASSPAATGLTMAEGMAILQYLTERKHLCTVCGYRWAVLENQYNQHCEECSKPTIVYSQRTKGSHFERILCQRFREWADSFSAAGLKDPTFQNPGKSWDSGGDE